MARPKSKRRLLADYLPAANTVSRVSKYTKDGIQDKMADLLDEKAMFEEFRKDVLPKLREAAKFSDIGSMLEAYAPYAVIGLMDLAQSARKEEVRLNARIRLLEHATGKPIQRNLLATKSLDELPEKELEALLRSELKRLKETNPNLHSQFTPLIRKEKENAPDKEN